MMVKICGITTLEDALAAIDEGATALGFNFYPPSPRYIAPETAAGIIAELPKETLKVGVFVNESPRRAETIADEAGLDIVQLHGKETADHSPRGYPVWKAFRVDANFSADQLRTFPADAYLLDSPTELYGGSGHTFDWTLARGIGAHIILAGGLDASNIRRAVAVAQPWGVDACSKLEAAPGRKDRAKMSAFLRELRNL